MCVCGIYLFQRVGVGREVNSSPVNQSKTTARERFAQRTDRKLGQGTEVPCPLNTSCRATTGLCTHWPRTLITPIDSLNVTAGAASWTFRSNDCHRERQSERERETERGRQRQTDRHTDRDTEREADGLYASLCVSLSVSVCLRDSFQIYLFID